MNLFHKILAHDRPEDSERYTIDFVLSALKKTFRQAFGKIRRFAFTHFRKKYVHHQTAVRQGACNQCGNCCEILFRCPFLLKTADGMTECSIYHSRPGQCAAFPIDSRCLSEVDFDCSYTFPASTTLQIEAAPLLHQAD